VYFPHSLGIFYQALTQYLGFPQFYLDAHWNEDLPLAEWDSGYGYDDFGPGRTLTSD
jgi:hypothetical protein